MEHDEIAELREAMLRVAARAGAGEHAEDLVHDCLLALLRASPRAHRAYAFGALYRRIALHRRELRRRRALPLDEIVLEAPALDVALDALVAALQLDGALRILAGRGGAGRVRVRVPPTVAPAWASTVAEAVNELLAAVAGAPGVTSRQGRRRRVRLTQALQRAAESVDVSIEVTGAAAAGDDLGRGIDPDADLAELFACSRAILDRVCAGRIPR